MDPTHPDPSHSKHSLLLTLADEAILALLATKDTEGHALLTKLMECPPVVLTPLQALAIAIELVGVTDPVTRKGSKRHPIGALLFSTFIQARSIVGEANEAASNALVDHLVASDNAEASTAQGSSTRTPDEPAPDSALRMCSRCGKPAAGCLLKEGTRTDLCSDCIFSSL